MPEGPDLSIAASYIRRVCTGKIFSSIVKSSVSKCAEIRWSGDEFKLSAVSRGKELMLSLEPLLASNNCETKYILFHFGMTGRFSFTDSSSTLKHSHLTFVTADGAESLSFVDTRRFGKWEEKMSADDWSKERGPSAITEYSRFRENIGQSLDDSVFNRPICEALLDQRYFNGIGNYLRAEIIYRARVPPFENARTVLRAVFDGPNGNGPSEGGDLLSLCKTVQEEAIALQTTQSTSSSDYLSDNYNGFEQWLQCYGKRTMSSMRDSNGRTMWFHGPSGSMARRRTDKNVKRKRGMSAEKASTVSKGRIVENAQAGAEQLRSQENEDTPVQGRKRKKRDINVAITGSVMERSAIGQVINHQREGVLTRSHTKKLDIKS